MEGATVVDRARATERADAPAVVRHLEQTVRVWLGISDPTVPVPRLPPSLAHLLLRLDEVEDSARDRWGCWPYPASGSAAREALREPLIDRWLAAQRAELVAQTPLEPLWPNDRRFAVCLTHDVDLVSLQSTPRQVLRYARAGLSPGVAERGEQLARLARPAARVVRALRAGVARVPSTRDTLERSVEVEARRGVVGSYFFTVPPWRLRSRYDCTYAPEDRCSFRNVKMRIGDVMCMLVSEGFDVGLHGGYAAGAQLGALTVERARLESATGLAITTTRQHFLHWDVRWTPPYQEAAGIRADSSLGFNANVGFRAGTGLPFRHFDIASGRALDLNEVPLVVQDTALLGPGGLDLTATDARTRVRELLDWTAELGTAITLLFHPDKFAQPEWLALYEWTLDEATARGGWLTSLDQVDRWWRSREARILNAA